MIYMLRILCAFLGGVTIVLSRSINAFLADRIGAFQSSFFNYLTGLLASTFVMLLVAFPTKDTLQAFENIDNYLMFLGGMIGVINIVILNLVVTKISPLALTLIVFIAQLGSGILIDYLLFDIFSFKKILGCLIVLIGLIHYQYTQKKR